MSKGSTSKRKSTNSATGSVTETPDNTDRPPDTRQIKPQKKMKQAFIDLQRGLVDTDLHGERGVEEVVKKDTQQHR